MATRGNLKKLRVGALKELAKDLSIETAKKRKAELIREILDAQVPASTLTPVVYRTENEAVFPEAKDNLPPFNLVTYQKPLPRGLKISFSNIYEFMISRRTESGNNVNNFKGMDRAVKHYDAGDVREVSGAQVDNSTVYVRARCYASMKKQDYNVYICLTKRELEGTTATSIDSAYCQCPIGLAQACSHIGALLFAISNMKDDEPQSCTSVLCQWKAPRANAKPQPMSAMSHKKASADSTMDPTQPAPHPQTTFDPRHSMDRTPDLDYTLQHLQKLKEIFPKTGMAHIWNIPDPVPMASYEEEIVTTKDPIVVKMEQMLFTVGNLPPPSIDMDLVMFIEKYTQEQRKCDMWKQLHIGRITSSLFGDVLSAGEKPNSLIRQIVEGSNLEKYTNMPASVQWGIDHEDTARVEYSMMKQALGDSFRIDPTGLTLCTTHTFLGASSDGRVTEGDGTGVLEIKCPYSIKGIPVNSMEIPDILEMEDPGFCLANTEEGPKLKSTHKYYAQVQGEMALMSAPWCDFVVWTAAKSNNICIDRVLFDPEFVASMMPKLIQFYMKFIFPVYYEQN